MNEQISNITAKESKVKGLIQNMVFLSLDKLMKHTLSSCKLQVKFNFELKNSKYLLMKRHSALKCLWSQSNSIKYCL